MCKQTDAAVCRQVNSKKNSSAITYVQVIIACILVQAQPEYNYSLNDWYTVQVALFNKLLPAIKTAQIKKNNSVTLLIYSNHIGLHTHTSYKPDLQSLQQVKRILLIGKYITTFPPRTGSVNMY